MAKRNPLSSPYETPTWDKLAAEHSRLVEGVKLLEDIWTAIGPYAHIDDNNAGKERPDLMHRLREYFGFDDSE